jgi:hypothetical protein
MNHRPTAIAVMAISKVRMLNRLGQAIQGRLAINAKASTPNQCGTLSPLAPAAQLRPDILKAQRPTEARHDNLPAIPSGGGFEGVARLDLVSSLNGSTDICTGTLLPTGRHILTAAHCVVDTNNGPLYPLKINLAQSSVNFFFSRK